jgi:hypothetical protein
MSLIVLACLLGQERKERENDCFSKTLFRKEKRHRKERERFRKKLWVNPWRPNHFWKEFFFYFLLSQNAGSS